MDTVQEKRLDEMLAGIKEWMSEEYDVRTLDPVVRMMLSALCDEIQKIWDAVDGFSDRMADRFCDDFVPRKNLSAVPAIVVVEPLFKKQKENAEAIWMESGTIFSFKSSSSKMPLNYIPLFQSCLLPISDCYQMVSTCFRSQSRSLEIQANEEGNVLWLGLKIPREMDSLKGVTLLFGGTGGLAPEKIIVGGNGKELEFVTMDRMEDIPMAEPFDAQQSSGRSFSYMREWKEHLLNMQEFSLVYITDQTVDRDVFKPKSFPKVFGKCLLSEDLETIKEGILWLKVVFADGTKLPAGSSVTVNAFPLVNVDVSQVMLTQSSPVAKLNKQDDAFFMDVLETSNQRRGWGFDIENDEYMIRDFDASCYHDGDLYRDVRQLYHHFIEDYYAFVEYNGIKDGEMLKQLREILKTISKNVGIHNAKYKFDSGVYALKNVNYYPLSLATKVSYITTRGKAGNEPETGQKLDSRKLPSVDKVTVMIPAACGKDKSTADERYEQLRYYALTGDRLYTRMDIDAFLRREIMTEFGSGEFSRIAIKISIEGAGGGASLQRGLYIDLEFKDKINYERALATSFAPRIQQRIISRSCLSLPVFVKIVNLDR